MARIPESEIKRLKTEISLIRLMESSGVELKKSGKDFACRCPFHEGDNEPSLLVSTDKNLFHCFACGAAGSVIHWVMKTRGVSFRHAVELLRNGVFPFVANAEAVKRSTVRTLDAPVNLDADDQQLLNQVIGYYHACLKQSPEALAYLESRGFTGSAAQEAIDTFKLGYANRTLGLRLPDKRRKEGEAIRSRLEKLGIYRQSGHEHFNGSLIVPVLDALGNVQEVYGRKLLDNLRVGTPKHLYLPGPHRGVFNVQALQASKEIILTESLIDALTFWCAGYRHVTASYGVEGFTEEHLSTFKQCCTERVLIAYDRDNAGDTAAEKLAERLMAEGIECFRLQFPHGMDANEYALKMQPASKSLGVVIRKAVWLGKGAPPPVAARCAVPVEAPTVEAIAPIPEEALLSSLAAEFIENETKNQKEFLSFDAPLGTNHQQSFPVSPVPPTAPPLPVKVTDQTLTLTLGERVYVVRGIEKNTSYEQLRVSVRATHGDFFHLDTVDLAADKQRVSWIKRASVELGVSETIIKADLGKLLRAVEQRQDELIRIKLSPKDEKIHNEIKLTPEQHESAMSLLRDPNLVNRIVNDVETLGVVGEASNALVGYLACVSRKLEKPLAILIQSTSAAGKSTLMDALLSLMPEAERVQYSAMTGQSLFYLGEGDLQHKILAIAEEEGVRQAAYALKLLQSQGELTIASTGKDPQSGNLITQTYRVKGPVMLFLTTTAIEIDEELLNRCLVLTINESREQTEAIHRRQREARTLQGLLSTKQGESIRQLHQAVQQLLQPLAVVNPYAEQLTFRSESTRMRRDHQKYLTLIDSIALLHQHQRKIKTIGEEKGKGIQYIEVTLDDIALANRLAHEVLGRSLDELPPQTRRVLGVIVQLVEERCRTQQIERSDLRFSRADVRAAVCLSETQLRLHLDRLVDLDYLLVHRGQRGQSFVYELLFDGESNNEAPQLIGLLDVEKLNATTTTSTSRGEGTKFALSSRPQHGVKAVGSRDEKTPVIASTDQAFSSLAAAFTQNALLEKEKKPSSYTNGTSYVPLRSV